MTMFSCLGSAVTVLGLCLVSLTDVPALQRVSRRETTEESSGRSWRLGVKFSGIGSLLKHTQGGRKYNVTHSLDQSPPGHFV